MLWSLPAGHVYGVNPYNVTYHDGSGSWDDHRILRSWQQRVALTTPIVVTVSGRFDGPSQRACVAVQKAHGLPVTAVLDEDTWRASWATQEPQKAVVVPDTTPTPLRPSQGAKALSLAAMRRNAGSILRRHNATRPTWYQGPTASLPKVRSILGLAADADPSAHLRALQTTHGLEVTGRLDTPTAWLVDEAVY